MDGAVGSKPIYPIHFLLFKCASISGVESWSIPLHFNSSIKFICSTYPIILLKVSNLEKSMMKRVKLELNPLAKVRFECGLFILCG